MAPLCPPPCGHKTPKNKDSGWSPLMLRHRLLIQKHLSHSSSPKLKPPAWSRRTGTPVCGGRLGWRPRAWRDPCQWLLSLLAESSWWGTHLCSDSHRLPFTWLQVLGPGRKTGMGLTFTPLAFSLPQESGTASPCTETRKLRLGT